MNIQCNSLCGDTLPLSLGRFAKTMTDGDYILLSTEWINRHLEFTGGSLTADRVITLPLQDGAEYVVYNGTSGGHALTFKAPGQTGVAVANAKTAIIRCNATDYVRVTLDA